MGDRTDANPKTRAMQASIAIFTRMHGAPEGETPVPQGKLGLMPYGSSGIALGFTLKPVAGIVRQAMHVWGSMEHSRCREPLVALDGYTWRTMAEQAHPTA
jgi:hypothetical protein